jgi:signal transduction histidine kinase
MLATIRGMQIRTIMISAAIAVGLLVAGAAAALFGLARSGQEGAAYLVLSVRSVEVAQQLRLDVGRLASGSGDLGAIDASIDRELASSQAMIQSAGEAVIVVQVRAAIQAVRRARSLDSGAAELRGALAEADRTAEALVAINVRQAHEAEQEVESSARRSEVLAALAAAALLAGTAALLVWTRSRLLKPLSLIRDRIQQVGSPARAAFNASTAPAEVRAVAAALETMASTLERDQAERLELFSRMTTSMGPVLTSIARAIAELGPATSPSLPALTYQLARLRSIVEESLDAARIDEGRLELNLEPLDLASLLEEIVESFGHFLDAGRSIAFQGGPPAPMRGDARRLTQALNGLLFLAARHAPLDSQITVAISEEPEALVAGIQVSAPKAGSFAAIFNALRNLDETAAGVPGSSFTLNTSRRVVAAHEGELQVTRAKNGALAFAVRFPRRPGFASPAPGP